MSPPSRDRWCLGSILPGAQGPGPSHQVHWQARKTYRSYSIPLSYKDLLVVQLAVGDFPLAEKRRERILPVFQEG